MIRFNEEELETIYSLVNKGESLSRISNVLKKSKTSVYYHFRKIKGKKFEPVSVNLENDELIGEFIGLFAGDGCFDKTKKYQYRVFLFFNITEREFMFSLINEVLLKLFKKRPMISSQGNKLILCYYSKSIYEFILKYLDWNKTLKKTYSIKLKNNNLSKEFHLGFIRGSLDSDGHFSKKKINFASVSERLIDNISESLAKLEIPHTKRKYKEKRENRKDMFYVDIPKIFQNDFIKKINPRNGIRFNK